MLIVLITLHTIIIKRKHIMITIKKDKNSIINMIEYILIILSISSIFTYLYVPNTYINSIYISCVTLFSSLHFICCRKNIQISSLTILLFILLCLFFYSSYLHKTLEYKSFKLYNLTILFLQFYFNSILFNNHKKESVKFILITILAFNLLFLIISAINENYILTIEKYFGNTGLYAIFLALSCIMFYNHIQIFRFTYPILITIIISAIIIPPIILLGSRSACILLLLYISFTSIKYIKSTYNKVILITLSLLVIISLSIFIKKESSQGRLFIIKTSALILKDYPLSGIGFDNFSSIYPIYQAQMYQNNNMSEKEIYLADNTNIALNEYIQIASESGLIGLIIFLLIIYTLIFYEKDNKILYICISIIMSFTYILHSPIIANLILMVLSLTKIPPITKFNKISSLIILNTAILLSIYNCNNYYRKNSYTNIINYLWEQSPQDINNIYMQHKKYLCDDAKLLSLLSQYNYNQNNIKMALILLYELDNLIRRNEIELLKSKCYIKINNFDEAEKHLLLSIAICPNRFISRFELFKLYKQQNKKELAQKTAK